MKIKSYDSKPASMSFEDWFVKETALDNKISIDYVRKVIKHQFYSLKDAMENSDASVVELYNVAKFKINPYMAKRKKNKLLNVINKHSGNSQKDETYRKNAQVEIDWINKKLSWE